MPSESTTKRQQFWRNYVMAAAAYEGSIDEHAKVHSLKTKDIYQWKTALTKRGLLPAVKEPASTDFIALQPVDPDQHVDQVGMTCRHTLACGAVLEIFAPLDGRLRQTDYRLARCQSAVRRNYRGSGSGK